MLERKCVVILIVLFAGFCNCKNIEVKMSGEWQTGLGWQLTCNWTFPADDRLQSVRLYTDINTRSETMFFVYRPETMGLTHSNVAYNDEFLMKIECSQTERKSYDGLCSILIKPLMPPNDTLVKCEVSGERPTFNEGKAEFVAQAYTPAKEAKFSSINRVKEGDINRVGLNCTAEGIPAPNLVWTVGDEKHKVRADFSNRRWNSSSTTWQVWSTLNYSPQYGERMIVECTPELRDGKDRGQAAVFSSGSRVTEMILLLATLLQCVALSR